MKVDLPAASSLRLTAFVDLLERWNRVYNLTAVCDPQAMVTRHIFDSLSILPWLAGEEVLDVGSGAGLPGIPLAIARPQYGFVLIDSNNKRTRFMTQVVAELRLTNVSVVRCRVESYQPSKLFDSVVSRAFSSVNDLLICAGRLCSAGGRILVMKGLRPDQELLNLPKSYALKGVYPLDVPGLNAARHVVHLAPDGQI